MRSSCLWRFAVGRACKSGGNDGKEVFVLYEGKYLCLTLFLQFHVYFSSTKSVSIIGTIISDTGKYLIIYDVDFS